MSNAVGERESSAGRFETGRSGNPGGRPKGSENRKKIWKRLLQERATIEIDGVQKTLSVRDALIAVLISKAGEGSLCAIDLAVALQDEIERRGKDTQSGQRIAGIFGRPSKDEDEWERMYGLAASGRDVEPRSDERLIPWDDAEREKALADPDVRWLYGIKDKAASVAPTQSEAPATAGGP